MHAEAQIKEVILKSLRQYEHNLVTQRREISNEPLPFTNIVVNRELLCVEQAMNYVSNDWKGMTFPQQTIDFTTKMEHTQELFRKMKENPKERLMGVTGDFQIIQVKYQSDRGFELWMGKEEIHQSDDLVVVSKLFAAMVV